MCPVYIWKHIILCCKNICHHLLTDTDVVGKYYNFLGGLMYRVEQKDLHTYKEGQ